MKVVILAGGKGTRLAPYTTVFPKPMMPLGDKPILEVIIRQLKKFDFNEFILSVGYMSDLIMAYFGDGNKFGVEISYSKEENPLGTAGPISLIDGLNETFLLMNGDVLTKFDFSKFIDFHRRRGGIATVAVNRRKVEVDYGVIRFDRTESITDYIEKPTLDYYVSMGIYAFEPKVLRFVKKGKKYDLPDLIRELLKAKEKVSAYHSDDYWLDIGRHDDYEAALKEYEINQERF